MTDLLLRLFFLPLYVYLAASTIYLLVLAVAGRWPKSLVKRPVQPTGRLHFIAILIPAFREDSIIVDTVRRALSHNYPGDQMHVVVIADQLKQSTIEALRLLPITLIEVAFAISMKSKSIHAGLQALTGNETIAVVLDADNVMEAGCLHLVNAAFNNGEVAMQCHRVAKNKNTAISLLDGISEEININLFRRGAARLGISAAPMGSGMAFSTSLLQEIFSVERILHDPGEDREIDFQLMKRNIRMAFLNDAILYDEKVDNTGSFGTQRLRWMEAQLGHLRRFFFPEMRQAEKGTLYYHKLVQTMLLPRLLYLVSFALIALLLLAGWMTGVQLLPLHPAWWLACMLLYCLVLLVSIPGTYYNRHTAAAVAYIPVLAVTMVGALFRMRRNRNVFLHTEKSVVNKN